MPKALIAVCMAHWNDLEAAGTLTRRVRMSGIGYDFGVTRFPKQLVILWRRWKTVVPLAGGADQNTTLGSGDTPLMFTSCAPVTYCVVKTLFTHWRARQLKICREKTALMWAVGRKLCGMWPRLIAAARGRKYLRDHLCALRVEGRGEGAGALQAGMTAVILVRSGRDEKRSTPPIAQG